MSDGSLPQPAESLPMTDAAVETAAGAVGVVPAGAGRQSTVSTVIVMLRSRVLRRGRLGGRDHRRSSRSFQQCPVRPPRFGSYSVGRGARGR